MKWGFVLRRTVVYNRYMNLEQLLKDYLDYLEIEKNRSIKTRENYEHYLRVFLERTGAKTVRAVDAETVRKFRLALAREDLKKITQTYYVIALRNFLKYLVKRGIPNVLETAAIAVAPDGGPSLLVVYCVPADRELAKKDEIILAMQNAIRRELNPLFKIHDLVLVETLPRTASNKVMRRTLRDLYNSKS